jgi:hypothetical protein
MERFRRPPGVNVAELRAARHPHLQRRAYAAWWVGAKVAPIESFVIRFSVPSQQLCCHRLARGSSCDCAALGFFFTYESVFVEERFVTGTYVV